MMLIVRRDEEPKDDAHEVKKSFEEDHQTQKSGGEGESEHKSTSDGREEDNHQNQRSSSSASTSSSSSKRSSHHHHHHHHHLIRKSSSSQIKMEWYIPHKDLRINEILIQGQFGDVCRGQWHGDVLIYSFPGCKDEDDLANFWREVESLSRIRHDNIQLFMGAVIEPVPCIVTSMMKGPSLYQQIHVNMTHLSVSHRMEIAKQVAQAVGYLHAKNIIVHRRLASPNIILEKKVKLCLMDMSMKRWGFNRCNQETFDSDQLRQQLCYLSPEIIRSLEFETEQETDHLVLTSSSTRREFTREDDSYAFGTILFELAAGKYPFSSESRESIIWRIGRGEKDLSGLQSLKTNNIFASGAIRNLINKCWSSKPNQRPSFDYILRQLQQESSNCLRSIIKQFSCSEPENLNNLGLTNNSSSNNNPNNCRNMSSSRNHSITSSPHHNNSIRNNQLMSFSLLNKAINLKT